MCNGDVHEVGIIVTDVLPIDAPWTERHPGVRDQLFELVGGKFVSVRRHHFCNARKAGLESDENESVPDFLLDRRKACGARIELLEALPFGRAAQHTVEAVAPGVIGTDEAPPAGTAAV